MVAVKFMPTFCLIASAVVNRNRQRNFFTIVIFGYTVYRVSFVIPDWDNLSMLFPVKHPKVLLAIFQCGIMSCRHKYFIQLNSIPYFLHVHGRLRACTFNGDSCTFISPRRYIINVLYSPPTPSPFFFYQTQRRGIQRAMLFKNSVLFYFLLQKLQQKLQSAKLIGIFNLRLKGFPLICFYMKDLT